MYYFFNSLFSRLLFVMVLRIVLELVCHILQRLIPCRGLCQRSIPDTADRLPDLGLQTVLMRPDTPCSADAQMLHEMLLRCSMQHTSATTHPKPSQATISPAISYHTLWSIQASKTSHRPTSHAVWLYSGPSLSCWASSSPATAKHWPIFSTSHCF